MTTSHAPSPEPEHPNRPTLEQIEEAVRASSERPEFTAEEREHMELLDRKVRATPRVEQPAPAPIDWEAHVLAIAERSRPVRRKVAQEQTARQRRIEDARRARAVGVTLDRLNRRFARFADATAEHPQVARWVRDTIRGGRDGLVLNGPVGVGKTHLAVAAYRAVVAAGVLPAVAVSVPALLDGLRPGREAVESLDACESARLLLLDDLAAERVTEWTGETLYRLIDARYARRLPTIVTTNAPGTMIRDTLGPRVASRLNGLGTYVVLDGPDRRTPAAH